MWILATRPFGLLNAVPVFANDKVDPAPNELAIEAAVPTSEGKGEINPPELAVNLPFSVIFQPSSNSKVALIPIAFETGFIPSATLPLLS